MLSLKQYHLLKSVKLKSLINLQLPNYWNRKYSTSLLVYNEPKLNKTKPEIIEKEKEQNHSSLESQVEVTKQNALSTVKDYKNIYLTLAKNRLSMFVVFTANAGYCLVNDPASFNYQQFWLGLSLGTYLCSASANTFNQIFEVPYDTQMTRTQSRPLVRGQITTSHASLFAVGCGLAGSGLLYNYCGLTTALLGASNIALYSGIYTSMKRHHDLNTQIGAIVGAIPPLMGAACTLGPDAFLNPAALSLSSILFFWQFPHFYALAYNRRHDYSRAGYKMLTLSNPKASQKWALSSALLLWPICLSSWYMEHTGHIFFITSIIANTLYTSGAVSFYKNMKTKEATRLFRYSLAYILLIVVGITLDIVYKRYGYYQKSACPIARTTALMAGMGEKCTKHEDSDICPVKL